MKIDSLLAKCEKLAKKIEKYSDEAELETLLSKFDKACEQVFDEIARMEKGFGADFVAQYKERLRAIEDAVDKQELH